ncbi:E3 ubiquitin-protein ligase RNF13 [Lucilia cuprina]|nr:E3 ubiquitin-protein ligase RNF13 [Lucilia cuprina]
MFRRMALTSQLSLVVSFIFGVCIFKTPLEVDGHILVYRRLTNQVILIEEYNDMPAQFGPSLPPNGIKVFAIPAVPHEEACDKISPPPKSFYPNNAKFAAIIQRGGVDCTFELKVRNAQAARFDAVVIYNNESDDLEHMSAQNSSGIFIPSVFVGRTTGTNLKTFYTTEIVLVINDELPFNINTQLILPFSILIGLCFLIMIFYMIYKCIREERRLRRHRLPKRMLKKLPIIKFTKNSDLAYDTCVICLDEFAEGDKLRVLPCKHPYHSECIDVWLTENKRDCPICKRKVFTKGETRSQRNRQSSLDSITDTDDDTTPLLQQSTNSSVNSNVSPISSNTGSTRSHGTFRRGGNNIEAGASGDITSDDENMLSPARRVNPFDRSPNLPPHLQAQLNSESRNSSIWSWPVLRWFRQPTTLSVAAPPYLEDVIAEQHIGSMATTTGSNVNNTINSTSTLRASHSSNNVLNPNLSGSFKDGGGGGGGDDDDDDDDPPLQCIYEPIATANRTSGSNTSSTSSSANRRAPRPEVALDANPDSVFIQTPTQGGIAVAALPSNNNNNHNNINTAVKRFIHEKLNIHTTYTMLYTYITIGTVYPTQQRNFFHHKKVIKRKKLIEVAIGLNVSILLEKFVPRTHEKKFCKIRFFVFDSYWSYEPKYLKLKKKIIKENLQGVFSIKDKTLLKEKIIEKEKFRNFISIKKENLLKDKIIKRKNSRKLFAKKEKVKKNISNKKWSFEPLKKFLFKKILLYNSLLKEKN